ncbi:hypothetical protein [uncultured Lacinutrix sp.]|uniref:hypothetical protein n=1 Tax=uncultured Lacinutrix sp. TaxID=574032 RepID=UPI002636CCEB|nr:hypothetical protein [uncultured Lacinutrix sp.]
MKHIYLFSVLLAFIATNVSCKASKKKDLKTNSKSVMVNCPKDGICTFEVLKNKSLQVEKDDIGSLYPILLDGKTNVLKFEYKRNEIPNTQDGNYSELIYVELPQKIENIKLNDTNLNSAKVLFARLCFCRGQTGYYKVSKGQLEINKNDDDSFNFKLNFKIDEVPQIITVIEESFKL